MHDLAIIIVSTNEGHWLRPCLESIFRHQGDISLDVVVADNESTDDTVATVESFAGARVVPCRNHGFAHANNRGYLTCDARYVLFLNPDTEVVEGTFEDLLHALDERPQLGLAGVKQLAGDGTLFPTIRRFPSVGRAIGDALAIERSPWRPEWLGERELDMDVYETEVACDWTSGSFMLARTEALAGAGCMDERFFLYSEEPDLCLRLKQAGWDVRHLPSLTIVHHANKAGLKPKLLAQDAYARMQYAAKHWGPARRGLYAAVLFLGYGLRYVSATGRVDAGARRDAYGAAIGTLLGRRPAPFGPPPAQSVRPIERSLAAE